MGSFSLPPLLNHSFFSSPKRRIQKRQTATTLLALVFMILTPLSTPISGFDVTATLRLIISALYISHRILQIIPFFFSFFYSRVEHILYLSHVSEISILGHFSGHHRYWLSSNFTNPTSEQVFNFTIFNSLEQLV